MNEQTFTWQEIEDALLKVTVADLEPFEQFLEEVRELLGIIKPSGSW